MSIMLSDREKEIYKLRHESGCTYREIASKYNICVERVRQIVLEAERKIKGNYRHGFPEDTPTRIYNGLKRRGFNSLEDLRGMSMEDICGLWNIGKISAEWILNHLEDRGDADGVEEGK